MAAMTQRAAAAPGAAAITHVGLVRTRNEDAVAVGADGRVLICADGLGGLPHGHVASRIATDSLLAALTAEIAARRTGAKRWKRVLRRAFLAAHTDVAGADVAKSAGVEIGTTAAAAVVTPRRAYVGHVGDVRCYLLSRRGLRRVTDDHSAVFEAVRAGQLTVEQARRHPDRNIVTQALGLGDDLVPTSSVVALARGDVLLLCSDGLWETMAEDDLGPLLATGQGVDAIAAELLARALEAGGPDNVSAVVYRHGPLE